MDLSAFDFRTGKMLMSKAHKSRQRVRYDSSNQVKVSGRRAPGGRGSAAARRAREGAGTVAVAGPAVEVAPVC